MKLKSVFISALLVASLGVFNSCGDEESKKGPEFFFKSESQIISLEGANFYLAEDFVFEDRAIRRYIISDGIFNRTNGGYTLADFDDATYCINMEMSMGNGMDFVSGDFNAVTNMSGFPAANTIVFNVENATGGELSYVVFHTNTTALGESIAAMSGGFEDGDAITIQFENAPMTFFHHNGTRWADAASTGTLHFKGVIDDQRPD